MTDHTEMQIPDDVMEAAKSHAKSYYDTRDPKSIQWEFDVLMVARAILAERNRCHDIAEAAGRYGICERIIHPVDK